MKIASKTAQIRRQCAEKEEIHPQADCSANRAQQVFQILTTLGLAWFV
jgi:hypothetical protein